MFLVDQLGQHCIRLDTIICVHATQSGLQKAKFIYAETARETYAVLVTDDQARAELAARRLARAIQHSMQRGALAGFLDLTQEKTLAVLLSQAEDKEDKFAKIPV